MPTTMVKSATSNAAIRIRCLPTLTIFLAAVQTDPLPIAGLL
jgi:hypothetical protein